MDVGRADLRPRDLRHVVLVGPMAVGKSTVGEALAGRLGRPLRDSDRDLAGARGTTGRELAAAEGVAALHRWEADHLLAALDADVPSVVTAAASTVDDARCRAALAPHVVVWLTAGPEVLAARLAAVGRARDDRDAGGAGGARDAGGAGAHDGEGHRRPVGATEAAALAARRDAAFRDVADLTVDAGERPPGEVVATVLAALPAGSGPSRVSHVGICVADLDRALRFYRDGLGFEPTESYEVGPEFGRLMEIDGVVLRSQFLRRDGVTVELLHFEAPGWSGGGERRPVNRLGLTHLSVRVADVGAAAARVVQAGGMVVDGTRTTFGEGADVLDFVYCTDPDGTRIELMRLPGQR
ncbi:MAG TPA: VOC family protein [Acidimicrobiales bacterium]|nr:VOC family protein [Acidimicrobiales bacterium]